MKELTKIGQESENGHRSSVAKEEKGSAEPDQEERKDQWYQWYLKEIRSGLKSKAKKKTRLYFEAPYSMEHREVIKDVENILETVSEIDETVLGGDGFLYDQAESLVLSQEIFESIKRDLKVLSNWGRNGNPWHCFNLRARQALEIGFLNQLSAIEAEKAEAGTYNRNFIKFQNRLNGNHEWVFVALDEDPTKTEKALFHLLHQLRMKCGKVASRHKN